MLKQGKITHRCYRDYALIVTQSSDVEDFIVHGPTNEGRVTPMVKVIKRVDACCWCIGVSQVFELQKRQEDISGIELDTIE
jgi:hypothetical protein